MLTEHQEQVCESIIDAIINNGARKIILRGSAGVGKTFMVQELITRYKQRKKTGGSLAYITAPTNRAVSVLQSKQPNAPYWMMFSTIHKALFLKRFINDKTGEVTFKPDYNPRKETPFAGGFIIIVDEGSMLNSELLFYLEDLKYAHIPMIFLGDDKQLNPVNENDSPVFLRKEKESQVISVQVQGKEEKHDVPTYFEFELTQIIRQANGNPIIHLSRNLQEIGLLEDNLTTDDAGYCYSISLKDCVDIISENENSRYLAWTNAEVNRVNKLTRQKLFTNPDKFEIGETIIFSEPYEGQLKSYWNNYELKINSIDIITKPFKPVVNFTYKDGSDVNTISIEDEITYYYINKDIKVVHESSEFQFLAILKKIKQLTKYGLSWKVWFNFSEMFARVVYRYAITVHKAQGGTFDTVIVNMKDLNRNKNVFERKRLWYTGITRASRKVIIYNAPLYEG